MRKSISIIVCFSLLSFLSLNLNAQATEEELDQVKLTKQFIGTWETEIGKDSVQQFVCTPAGEGMLFKIVYKSDGKVYAEGAGLAGFSPDRKTIEFTAVWPNGVMTHDIGRFVSENKMVMERFMVGSPAHAVAVLEYNISPDSYSGTWYGRGQNITWDPLWENTFNYTKVK
ncbi:MAG: hypothetical protein ACWGNV_16355 [Bacteroidales bacterium]